MCGIVGLFSGKSIDTKLVLDSLSHRGPDNSGFFKETILGKNLFLGHTRLSILDLSANGNQPMISADGMVVIVFNGEVYNFAELRRTHLKDETFLSHSDTEVVLKLYLKKGLDFVSHLNGDFAMAIYDKRLQKLILIRDRVGVKPLYFFKSAETFAFGSEIKSILACSIKPELNKDELQNYFVFKYSPQNKTLFKNIYRVPPASVLELNLNNGSLVSKTYWNYTDKKNSYSYSQAQEQLVSLVQQSTNDRLIADVPIGNFLSGGLDSTIIASLIRDRKDIIHYCAQKSEHDLKAEGTTSDFYYAQKLANEWGLNFKALPITANEANIELIRKTLFYSDDLIADGSQIPSYLITSAAAKQSKVILSGMGADELFLGYAGHMLTLISSKHLAALPEALVNGLSKIDQGKGRFLAYRRYLHKLGKYNKLPKYKYGLFNIVGDFENSLSVANGNKENTLNVLNQYFDNGSPVFENLFRFEMDNFLVKNLHYTDRMSMANSVECRVPFLDHRIVEFAFGLPTNYKISVTGGFKKILKDSFAAQIPTYVTKRRKAGFGMPLRSIFKSEQTVYGLLDIAFFVNFDTFSVDNIKQIVNNHIAGKEDNSSIIYALISFQEWYKINFS